MTKYNDKNEIPLDFWIETVESRANVMGTDLDVKTLGWMHFDEYSHRLEGETKKSKIDFAKSRMKGFADAYNYFTEELSKLNKNAEKNKKYIESCIYHADASFIGAQLIAETNGMKNDKIRKYIPIKKVEKAISDALTSDEIELPIDNSLNNNEPIKDKSQSDQSSKQIHVNQKSKHSNNVSTKELNQRRVFIRDTIIKLMYVLISSILLYIVFLFYRQYKLTSNRASSNSSRGYRRDATR